MACKRKDWLWIQKRYEMGYTVRQIAKDYSREYPDTVSFQAIAKVAKQNNWHRELTERYRKSVEHKIVEKAKSQQLVGYLARSGDKVDASEADIDEVAIDDASDISSQVVLEHQLNALIWLTVVKRKKSHPCQLFFSGPFPGHVPGHPQRRSQCCDG